GAVRALGALRCADRAAGRPGGPLPWHPGARLPGARTSLPERGVPAASGHCGRRAVGGAGMRVLHWHVHGSWSTAFVRGPHTHLVPVTPDRDADGRGRARTFDWPPGAV